MIKEIFMRSSPGPYLETNEDFSYYNIKEKFFSVIDGFGGPGRGDALAKTIPNLYLDFFKKLSESEDKTQPFYFSKRYSFVSNALINALMELNKKIFQQNSLIEPEYRSGASFLTCFTQDEKLYSITTGNCSMFRLRHNKLEFIQTPDSLNIFCPYKNGFPQSIIPWSSIGLYAESFYQVKEFNLKENDQFLLVTDGAIARLTLPQIEDILLKSKTAAKIIEELFDLSNENGNIDNQTAILVKF